MSLQIIKPGLLSLIQDLGRFGYQSSGITHGGAMDSQAFAWANKLLSNHKNDAQIEITYGGFKAKFTKPCHFAICGADLGASLKGKAISPWRSFQANEGDLIEFKSPSHSIGLRAYLAVSGGFQTPSRLGSRSMVVREGLGDSAIKKGELVSCSTSVKPTYTPTTPPQDLPLYAVHNENGKQGHILHFHPFHTEQTELANTLLDNNFIVSNQIDRMGYRLNTEAANLISSRPNQPQISYGTTVGMIQIPPDGNPIILMRDRQTMGGYPLLGCLNEDSINLLAQCPPMTRLSFKTIV